MKTFQGKLVDGVRQNKKHPETFSIPSRSDKLKIRTGVYVKICFINPDKHKYCSGRMDERMWVMVEKEVSPRKYQGSLHNDPASFQRKVLKYGDKVIFESRHILDIIWNGE